MFSFLSKKKNKSKLDECLVELATNEEKRLTSKRHLGETIETAIYEGRFQELGVLSEKYLKKYPKSVLLSYIFVLYLLEENKFSEASDFISKKIIESNFAKDKKTTTRLMNVWRVLDLTARNNMKWADGNNTKPSNYDDLSFSQTTEFLEKDSYFDADLCLFYAEPCLQGKNENEYINICQVAFDKSKTLEKKLKIIFSLRRDGVRRIVSNKKRYQVANALFESIQCEIDAYIESSLKDKSIKNMKVLRTLLNVSRNLGKLRNNAKIEKAIIDIVSSEDGKSTVWTGVFALLENNLENYQLTKSIIDKHIMSGTPEYNSDISHFMEWAILAEEYNCAYNYFSKQPRKVKESKVALSYLKLLHRMGKFEEAFQIARGIHLSMLVRSHNLCPYSSFSLIKRIGEFKFLKRTNEIYNSVPQPKEPDGVLFIIPRSVEQLRRVPIVILMELKRLNWAIIPLSEGLLPDYKTGNRLIDSFGEIISMNRGIRRTKTEFLKPLQSEFHADLDRGLLEWNQINLSHILWEESAINKRAYDVDYSCPSLQKYLENVANVTMSAAIALENIYIRRYQINVPISFMINFNARLPDSLYRFYCEKYGSADKFFCVHAANGYQNYFSNFSTNISSKAVIRNMTKHSDTRSASFPLKEDFEEFCKQNERFAEEILDAVSNVTSVKRSVSHDEQSVERKVAYQFIKNWRKKGGKVACAFGKVVCDSGVPIDGGDSHESMKEWINHSIKTVNGSETLLLIKPHPHELNQEVSTFGNQCFKDIITEELNPNVLFLHNNWFKMHELKELIDFGIVYNGTSSIELALMNIPTIVIGWYAPIDYPVGLATAQSKKHYEKMLTGKSDIEVDVDMKRKAAMWIYYMGGSKFTLDYRYHSRPITNKVVYPPYWFEDDILKYLSKGDDNVTRLAMQVIGEQNGHK